MNLLYKKLETWFETLVNYATRFYGNSLTFILALGMVLFYIASPRFYRQDAHDSIKDIILCITFISFFIIQKSMNRFSVAINLKMNELVAAHEKASNKMINVENKSEEELKELSQHYSTLIEKINDSGDQDSSHSIDHILDEKSNSDSKE